MDLHRKHRAAQAARALLTQNQIDEIRSKFALLDKDDSASISESELGVLLRSLGHKATKAELKKMLGRVDMDGNGEVDFDEFLFMMARQQQQRKDPEQDIAEAFSVLDEDGDGFLYPHELKRAVAATTGEELTDKEVSELMLHADLDRKGFVTYEDFVRILEWNPPTQKRK